MIRKLFLLHPKGAVHARCCVLYIRAVLCDCLPGGNSLLLLLLLLPLGPVLVELLVVAHALREIILNVRRVRLLRQPTNQHPVRLLRTPTHRHPLRLLRMPTNRYPVRLLRMPTHRHPVRLLRLPTHRHPVLEGVRGVWRLLSVKAFSPCVKFVKDNCINFFFKLLLWVC